MVNHAWSVASWQQVEAGYGSIKPDECTLKHEMVKESSVP